MTSQDRLNQLRQIDVDIESEIERLLITHATKDVAGRQNLQVEREVSQLRLA